MGSRALRLAPPCFFLSGRNLKVDWLVSSLVAKLEQLALMERTLILFTGDNGPDLYKGQSGGSAGLDRGSGRGHDRDPNIM